MTKLDGVNSQLSSARKLALTGDYEAALGNFDGVLEEIQRCGDAQVSGHRISLAAKIKPSTLLSPISYDRTISCPLFHVLRSQHLAIYIHQNIDTSPTLHVEFTAFL